MDASCVRCEGRKVSVHDRCEHINAVLVQLSVVQANLTSIRAARAESTALESIGGGMCGAAIDSGDPWCSKPVYP